MRVYLVFGKTFLPTLANFVYNRAIFYVCKWTNNENYKRHLVTLAVSSNIISTAV